MTLGNDPNDRLTRPMTTPTTPTTELNQEEHKSVSERVEEARDRAQDAAEQARRRAQDAGQQAADRANDAMTSTGERMSDVARTLREKAPNGQAGEIAQKAAGALERGGDYLRRSEPQDVQRDLENVMRSHPMESLAIGLGFGFLLARSMRSRRG